MPARDHAYCKVNDVRGQTARHGRSVAEPVPGVEDVVLWPNLGR
jgi:hypothetical protein